MYSIFLHYTTIVLSTQPAHIKMLTWISSFFTETSGCSKPVSPPRRNVQKEKAFAEFDAAVNATILKLIAQVEAEQAEAANATPAAPAPAPAAAPAAAHADAPAPAAN